METIKEALKGFIGKLPSVAGRLKGYRAAEQWQTLIDPSGNSWVQKFSSGTLFVVTESPSFCQEAGFSKAGIIEKLNSAAKESVIKDLRIRVGSRAD